MGERRPLPARHEVRALELLPRPLPHHDGQERSGRSASDVMLLQIDIFMWNFSSYGRITMRLEPLLLDTKDLNIII